MAKCLFFIALTALLVSADTRPIEMQDILNWKRITVSMLSPDGKWLAYRVVPNEGDAELILKHTDTMEEKRYAVGEGVGRSGSIAFSDDSKYLAFEVAPKRADARKARKDKKPLQNQVTLVELSTQKTTTWDKVRSFQFAAGGSRWLALQRYAATESSGSDLNLVELPGMQEMNIGNVGEYSFDKQGRLLAYTIQAADQVGNGVQIREASSGRVWVADSAKAKYRSLQWTEKGDALAFLKGMGEPERYHVIGYRVNGDKAIFAPEEHSAFPKELMVSGNRKPEFSEDLSLLSFGIEKAVEKPRKKGDAADAPDTPEMLVWHYKDTRLAPMQVVQEREDRNFSYLATYGPATKRFSRLADEKLRTVTLAPKQQFALGRDRQPYEMQAALNGQRFEDLYVVDPRTGERKLALQKLRWVFGISPDGEKLLYFKEGHFYSYHFGTGLSQNLSEGAGTSFVNTETDVNVTGAPTPVLGWTADSTAVLVTDLWDVWKLPLKGKAANLSQNGRKEQIRYERRFTLDPDEKGIDLAKPQYFAIYGEWTKKGGVSRLDPGAAATRTLVFDNASYGGLLQAKKAETIVYTRQTVADFPDFGTSFESPKQLSLANAQQKDFAWSAGSQLVDYKCELTGTKAQAALFLPANFEPGKQYPTIVYIYEKLSQGKNTYGQPALDDRFNRSVYNSHGYAVLLPDIHYKLNDPGRSAAGCVLPALQAAIASGVVDAKRVGLHGHSWGGYETSFIVTQTEAFKTAIAGAPLTDLVSMYSSVYWNTGGSNQAIFESSQGRFTSGYMDNPEPYIRNSPVFHAQNVKTPLMILHNDKDGAVDFTQGVEYFNTLRRLQKPVVMLQYKGENHHLAKPENSKDFLLRMKEYYDHHLKGASAPEWLTKGVAVLDLKDEVETRARGIAGSPR
jgi:dipeptidyl aminopeptidase/acylaminoacyl peptidase